MSKKINQSLKFNFSKSLNKNTIFSLFKHTPEYIFVLDNDNNIVFCNDNLLEFTQLTDKTNLRVDKLKGNCDVFYKSISKIYAQRDKITSQDLRDNMASPDYVEVHGCSGERCIMYLSSSLYKENDDVYRVVLLSNHTKISLREQELVQMVSIDYLTKAYNRRHMTDILEKDFLRFVRNENLDLSIMFLDLDFFKRVNDQYGHHAGDSVLIDFSNIVMERLRKSDNFGRMGGEEFCISLTDTDAQKAELLAKDLLDRVRNSNVKMDNGNDSIQYTCSIGIATLTTDFKNVDQWLGGADRALYFAKNNGRDQCCHFDNIKGKDPLRGYSSSLSAITGDGHKH